MVIVGRDNIWGDRHQTDHMTTARNAGKIPISALRIDVGGNGNKRLAPRHLRHKIP